MLNHFILLQQPFVPLPVPVPVLPVPVPVFVLLVVVPVFLLVGAGLGLGWVVWFVGVVVFCLFVVVVVFCFVVGEAVRFGEVPGLVVVPVLFVVG